MKQLRTTVQMDEALITSKTLSKVLDMYVYFKETIHGPEAVGLEGMDTLAISL
jgi:hypothetical protein